MNSEQIKFPIRKFAASKKINFYSSGRSSHYDSTVGRWTTKDPIGFAGGDTNLYAYVGGNPMSYVDPSGLAKACKRPLQSDDEMYLNPVLDFLDLEKAHEQIFYDDGTSVGYFENGIQKNGENKTDYVCDNKHYDDAKMKDAVKRVQIGNKFNARNYGAFTNNCQDFVSTVINGYRSGK